MNKEIKSSNKESKMILKIVAFVTFIIFLVLWVSHMATCDNATKYNGLGEIGDTIGGLTAPIIGLLAAYLVYISFEEQRKANISNIDLLKLQKEQFDEEKKRNQRNDWYNKHYELFNDIRLFYKNIEAEEFNYSPDLMRTVYYGSNAFKSAIGRQFDSTFFRSVIYLLITVYDLVDRLDKEKEYLDEAIFIKNQLSNLYYRIIVLDVTDYYREFKEDSEAREQVKDIIKLQYLIHQKLNEPD